MNLELRNFVLAVLDDDHGISETAWDRLMELLQNVGELERIGEVSNQIGACDGRVYIK